MTEFYIALRHSERGSTVKCDGELDLVTAARLNEAIDLCLEREPAALHVDGRGISLLTSAGIKALLQAAAKCDEMKIPFTLTSSSHARKVLDLVGLWWLGIVDDGMRLQTAMKDALASYAHLRFAEELDD